MAGHSSKKKSGIPTQTQVSAGGVAFQPASEEGLKVVVVAVGRSRRWQLPKGLVEPNELPEEAALREVEEEAGVQTKLLAPIKTIEYWYVGTHKGQRVRFHKFVHFYLLAYRSGNVQDHDWEVHEARWMPISQAVDKLAFANEQTVVKKARQMIEERHT